MISKLLSTLSRVRLSLTTLFTLSPSQVEQNSWLILNGCRLIYHIGDPLIWHRWKLYFFIIYFITISFDFNSLEWLCIDMICPICFFYHSFRSVYLFIWLSNNYLSIYLLMYLFIPFLAWWLIYESPYLSFFNLLFSPIIPHTFHVVYFSALLNVEKHVSHVYNANFSQS